MKRFLLTVALFSILTAILVGCAKDFETVKIRFADESDTKAEADLERLFADCATIKASGAERHLAEGFGCYRGKLYGSGRVLIEGYLLDNPGDWRGHYVLALLEIADENFEGAERCLQTALRFSDQQARQRAVIYLALGRAVELQGRSALSKQHYVTAMNLDSSLVAAQDGIDRLTTLTSVEP